MAEVSNENVFEEDDKVNKNQTIYLDQTRTAAVDIFYKNGKLSAVVKRVSGNKAGYKENEDDYINNLNKLVKLELIGDGKTEKWGVSLGSGSSKKDNIVEVEVVKDEEKKSSEIKVLVGEFKTSENSNRVVVRNYQEFGSYNFEQEKYLAKRFLTITEQRILSSGTYKEIADSGVPFSSEDLQVVENSHQQCDLHSHANAVLPGEKVIELGIKNDASLSFAALNKVGQDKEKELSLIKPKLEKIVAIRIAARCSSDEEILSYIKQKSLENRGKNRVEFSIFEEKEDAVRDFYLRVKGDKTLSEGEKFNFTKILAMETYCAAQNEIAENVKNEIYSAFEGENFFRFASEGVKLNEVVTESDKEVIPAMGRLLELSPDRSANFKVLNEINVLRSDCYAYKQSSGYNLENMKETFKAIAEFYKASGQTYCELSDFGPSDSKFLKAYESIVGEVEKKDVTISFLAGISRGEEKQLIEKTKSSVAALSSKYVTGIDYLGEELNSAKEIEESLKYSAEQIMVNYPGKTLRVHAGENDYNNENIKISLQAIEAAHDKVTENLGKEVEYPNVRIGHGVYGLDRECLDLLNKMGGTIELNPNSNFSFNHINSKEQLPIQILMEYREYCKKENIECNLKISIGSDGPGIYSGSVFMNEAALLGCFKDKAQMQEFYVWVKESDEKNLAIGKENIKEYVKPDGLSDELSDELTDELETTFAVSKTSSEKSGADSIKEAQLQKDFNEQKGKFDNKKPITLMGLTKEQFERNEKQLLIKYKPIIESILNSKNCYINLDSASAGAFLLTEKVCEMLEKEGTLTSADLKDKIIYTTNKTEGIERVEGKMSVNLVKDDNSKKTSNLLQQTSDKGGVILVAGGGVNAEKQVAGVFAKGKGATLLFDGESKGVAGEYSKYDYSCGQAIDSKNSAQEILSELGVLTGEKELEEKAKSIDMEVDARKVEEHLKESEQEALNRQDRENEEEKGREINKENP